MKTKRPYLMMAAVVLLWGTNIIVSRFLTGVDPVRVSGVFFALFRYVLAALTMIFIMIYQRKGPREINEETKPYRRVLLASVLFASIFVVALHTSTEFISSGTTSIIINLNPIIVLVFGVIFLKERLSPMKLLGFVLGFLGGSIFLFSSLSVVPGFEIGLVFAVLGMMMWGAYTITLHFLEGANRYTVMTVTHVTSSLIILLFIIGLLTNGVPLILIIDSLSVAGLLFSGVIASGIGYVLYFTAIEELGAPRASSFLFLMPFVSVIGDFLLGEPPEFVILLAGIVAIIGVGLVRLSGVDKTG
ncbi:MAG: DMT family transporter [Candidatus Thorarchaeota archaeon]|nr:MAG: DMT family transporter [Candidatus Thorarchaeota archaeon]